MHIAIAGFFKSAKSECFWRTAEHFAVTLVMRKEPRHTWLKSVSLNPPNVAETLVPSEKKNCRTRDWKTVQSEKKNYRTRGWKILVPSEKKDVQNTWLENFGADGKKQLQNTWLENFGAVGKNSCRTRGWKMLVQSEKKELQNMWLENNFGTVGKKRTRDWKICAVGKPRNRWLKKYTCLWEKYLWSAKPNRKLLHNVYQL